MPAGSDTATAAVVLSVGGERYGGSGTERTAAGRPHLIRATAGVTRPLPLQSGARCDRRPTCSDRAAARADTPSGPSGRPDVVPYVCPALGQGPKADTRQHATMEAGGGGAMLNDSTTRPHAPPPQPGWRARDNTGTYKTSCGTIIPRFLSQSLNHYY